MDAMSYIIQWLPLKEIASTKKNAVGSGLYWKQSFIGKYNY